MTPARRRRKESFVELRAFRRLLAVLSIGALFVILVPAPFASAPSPRGRVPTRHEQQKIVSALSARLAALASSPTSGFQRGTVVVVVPICVSLTDGRFASVVGSPVDHRVVGQPLFAFFARRGTGFHVLGIGTGQAYVRRPPGVPAGVYRELTAACADPPRAARLLNLRATGQVPSFTIR